MDDMNSHLNEQSHYTQHHQYLPEPAPPPPLQPELLNASPQRHSPQPYFHPQVERFDDEPTLESHEDERDGGGGREEEGKMERDPSDERQLSKCFKNSLAYAGRGRRLFKMRRGGNRGAMMNRGMSGARKMLYGRRDSSPTAVNMPTMKESGVMLTSDVESRGRRWSLNRSTDGGRSSAEKRGCWSMGLKRKTKCCVKKCRRCRSTCFKLILVLFNFFFVLCGWSLILLGSYIHLNHSSYLYSHLLTSNPVKAVFAIHKIPFFLIGAGMVVSIVSFLGCCGACTESVCFLSFYSFFLSIMVLGEVVLGVMSNTLRIHVSQQMHSSMMYQITHLYNSTAVQANETAYNVLQLTRAWDSLHHELKCCGVMGPKDFDNSSWHSHVKDGDGVYVPASCCTGTKSFSLCQAEALLHPRPKDSFLGSHYVDGCLTVILGMANTQLNSMTLTLACLITIQCLDLVLACVLMSWVKKKQSDYWWGADADCA